MRDRPGVNGRRMGVGRTRACVPARPKDGWENVKQSKCKTDHLSATTTAHRKRVFQRHKDTTFQQLLLDGIGDKRSKGTIAKPSLCHNFETVIENLRSKKLIVFNLITS